MDTDRRKRYSVVLAPTQAQAAMFEQWFSDARTVWNWALKRQRAALAQGEQALGWRQNCKLLTQFKRETDPLACTPIGALQRELWMLRKATARWRRSGTGEPILKSRTGTQSVQLTLDRRARVFAQAWEGKLPTISGKRIRLPRAGLVAVQRDKALPRESPGMMRIVRTRNGVYRAHFLIGEYVRPEPSPSAARAQKPKVAPTPKAKAGPTARPEQRTGVVTVTEARQCARVATTDKGVKLELAQEIVRDAERAHELQMEIDAQWGPPQRTAAIKRERQQCRHRCTVGLRREMEATAVDLVKGRKTIVLRMLKGLRHKRVQDWQGELFSKCWDALVAAIERLATTQGVTVVHVDATPRWGKRRARRHTEEQRECADK